MPPAGLADKVVIVTGGASGIGLAVADRLLAEGSCVVCVDVDAQGVSEVSADRPHDRLLGVVADVSTEDGSEAYLVATRKRFGRVDGLHANAGIAEPGPAIAETAPADFDRMIAVNLRGVFLAIRGVLRVLSEQGTPGSIVTTASVLGLRGFVGSGSYCASKAGVISLTQTAALEAGPNGHRVNAVLPGPIETSMARRIEESLPLHEREQFRNDLRSLVPLGRYGQAPEVASLVAWLLSDESSYVTGGIFSVDGGQAAG
jgi:NAD(P)-dependent dehydrogenase (short-subunit alcohol dehydrogenase family)